MIIKGHYLPLYSKISVLLYFVHGPKSMELLASYEKTFLFFFFQATSEHSLDTSRNCRGLLKASAVAKVSYVR